VVRGRPVRAGCIPLDEPTAFAQLDGIDRLLARSAARTTLLLRAFFVATRMAARTAPGLLVRASTRGAPAPEVAAVAAQGRWLATALGEGARSGRAGVAEYRALCAPWGFTLGEVAVPVTVHQGEADHLVPPAWADQLVTGLPRATLVTYPGEGHFIAVTRRREVLAGLVPGAGGAPSGTGRP
jgi:fermentation-respiration switch protein FrsA (DUF1100 family)